MRIKQITASQAFLVLGVALVAAYLHTPWVRSQFVLYEAASVLGAGALLVGLRWRLPPRIRGWRLFSAAVILYAIGDAIWCVSDFGVAVPGHLSDGPYLAAYPFFGWALVSFSASRREPFETVLRQLVDAAIVFVAAFSAVWFLLIDPIVDRGVDTATNTALNVIYPTLDLAILALLLRFAFTSGRWPTSYRLVTVAFGAMFIGDMTWRLWLADGSYSVDSWINTLFMAASILWGAAALHPSVAEIERFSSDAAAARPAAAWRRLILLGVAAVVPAVVLLLARKRMDDQTDLAVFALVIALLPVLSLVRVADLVRAVRRSAADFDEIVRNSPVPTCVVDRDGTVLVWNAAAEATSGHAAEDVLGGPPPIVPAEDEERVLVLYREALQGIRHARVDVKLLHPNGDPIDVRVSTAPLHDAAGRIIAIFEDVTSERRQQAEIAFLAHHDPLTGLPNRRKFEDELRSAIRDGRAEDGTHLALFDIDNFKLLNDTGGHATGDAVLRELSALLRDAVRQGDFLGRLSGDEFALILRSMSPDDAVDAVEQLLDVARDYRLRTNRDVLDVTLSAGIYTLAPGDSETRTLQRADEALYRAKRLGKNHVEQWTEPTPHAAPRRWSPIIKDALADDRLDLYLQPIVNLSDHSTAFHEALCRLRMPNGEIIAAGEWIEDAEQLGLMPPIDIRMLEEAKTLLEMDSGYRIFVNLSASSLHDRNVLRCLERTLATVPRGSLGIEITEHAALEDLERVRATLTRIRAAGAPVAIDDFGLGFTSFAELGSLPCDIVKIPGSFASTATTSGGGDAVIAHAISLVAHHYGKRVVIEGVENASIARQAKLLGIEYGQGWHFGAPSVPDSESQPERLRLIS